MAALTSSILQAGAQREAGLAQQSTADFNARMSELRAVDAIRRGRRASTEVRRRGKTKVGAQRAALAAQGIDISEGSALEIQEETAELSELDALTVKNNAAREALGFKIKAADERFGGELARISANVRASQTILTGGMQAAEMSGDLMTFGLSKRKTKKGKK